MILSSLTVTLLLQAAPVATPPAKAPAKEKVICRSEDETGSRLSQRRRCMTATQWMEIRNQERQTLERVQSQARTPSGL